MKLSFIIPVYNVEKYIGECLDSLLNQDIEKTEYEIICVNDGSTDNSANVIEQYAEKNNNIRLINKENGGVSSARNLGLKEAKGDYIWFVDGDDAIAPNCLSCILDIVLKSNSQSFLFRSQHFIDVPNFIGFSGEYKSCSNSNEMLKFMEYSGGAGVCGNIYNRSFLINNKIYFYEDIRYSEDVLFNFITLMNLKYASKTNDTFLYIRDRKNSAMHSIYKNIDIFSLSMYRLIWGYNDLLMVLNDEEKISLCKFKCDLSKKALLFNLVKTGSFKKAHYYIKLLKKDKLYPYPIYFRLLKGNKGIKNKCINTISFLFPIKPYFYFCVFCGKVNRVLRGMRHGRKN